MDANLPNPALPTDPPTDLSPTEVLQLVGHPVRWRLLGELARSDRTVRELTGLIAEPQNLVSYHLGKLRDARVVVAQRSSADRRDSYYAIDLTRIGGLLGTVGAALHPGLRASPPASPSARAVNPVRVLFLCTGNSARSQMAEALARVRSRGAVDAHSAGSHPKPIHPNALKVMREAHGIDLGTHTPKHLGEFADQPFDWVISLCDQVREVCPAFPGNPATIHWSIRNPAAGNLDEAASLAAFQRTAAELEIRVGFLLAVLADGSAALPSPDTA